MIRGGNRAAAAGALMVVALASAGCSRVRGHQGFIADLGLVDSIQPGIDNRDSVVKTLGRPSFEAQFGERDWYYVARTTKALAFATPQAADQVILRVKFDPAGNVSAVDKAGMEKIARIDPENKKTPTLGKDRSFLEDLFGNIGTVGAAGQGASTTDNPN